MPTIHKYVKSKCWYDLDVSKNFIKSLKERLVDLSFFTYCNIEVLYCSNNLRIYGKYDMFILKVININFLRMVSKLVFHITERIRAGGEPCDASCSKVFRILQDFIFHCKCKIEYNSFDCFEISSSNIVLQRRKRKRKKNRYSWKTTT